MTIRVMLISPALSTALREARFGDGGGASRGEGDGEDGGGDGGGGPLDAAGLRQAEAARDAPGVVAQLGAADRVFASPSGRCRQTAEALGLLAEPVPELRGCAMGRWRGMRLDEVGAAEPDAVAAWLTDPAAAPHGGESLEALHVRLGEWLDGLGTLDGLGGSDASDAGTGPASARVVAVAEPDVVRALTVRAIGAPTPVFWRIDVRPLTLTELSGRNGRWNLLGGHPLHGGSDY